MLWETLKRRVKTRIGSRHKDVRWSFLLNGGARIQLASHIGADAVRVSIVGLDGDVLMRPDRLPSGEIGPGPLDYAVPAAFFSRRATCRLLVEGPDLFHVSAPTTIEPGSFVGALDGVIDYALTGWLSPLFEADDFEATLLVDGEPAVTRRASTWRRELLAISTHGGWNGFSLPLPARVLDGSTHELGVRAGHSTLTFGRWSARPTLIVEEAGPRRIAGRFFDEALRDTPATITIRDKGHALARVTTVANMIADGDARLFAGFEIRGTEPFRAGQILAAGVEPGLVLGTLVPNGYADHVDDARAGLRRQLLAGASLATRNLLRDELVLPERDREAEPIRFEPAGAALRAGPATVAPMVPAPISAPTPRRSCVIVPVETGLAGLQACLDGLLPQLENARSRLVIVNDASPDAGIHAYLARFENGADPRVTLLTNAVGLGFVGSVNRGGSELRAGEDAVIVNAATILPRRALEKLARCCHASPGIASVTPMSNGATLGSFPRPFRASPPTLGLSADELDETFEAIGAEPVAIPAAAGFCIYLNRAALEEVGWFSPAWEAGSFAEVEWSLLARDLGWEHVAATDTFILHADAASSGAQDRAEILAKNHAELGRLFPEYAAELDAFGRADPLADIRARAAARILATRYSRLTLHLVHRGGGTERSVTDLTELTRDTGHEVGVVAPIITGFGEPVLSCSFAGAGFDLELSFSRYGTFLTALAEAGLSVMQHVHSRLGWHESALSAVMAGPVPYLVSLSDFQWYCPRVKLVDERRFYCGEPPAALCQLCVRHGSIGDFADQTDLIRQDLPAWLTFNEHFLRGAAALAAPSRDTLERYRTRLGISDGRLVPPAHDAVQPASPGPSRRRILRTSMLRIAVVGAIGDHEGYEGIERLLEHATRVGSPVRLRFVGSTRDDIKLSRFPEIDITGRGEAGGLGRQLDAYRPDFVLLPTVWPEPYSDALSQIAAWGHPVVAFDWGGAGERIRASGCGVLIAPTRDAAELFDSLVDARERLATIDATRVTVIPPLSLESYYRDVMPGARRAALHPSSSDANSPA